MFAPLPDMGDFLSRYRLQARRQTRRNLMGGHITRRIGQSLEFRDYASYYPGDDIRHVDWRATFRMHGNRALTKSEHWLLRRYQAEERLSLLVSVDTRATLLYPQAQARRAVDYGWSKLQIARWLGEALTQVALEQDDRVSLHALFGEDQAPQTLQRRDDLPRALDALPLLDDASPFNAAELDKYLPPTAAWLILSDFYFDTASAFIARARQVPNWVILVELDSWPAERAALDRGARLIDGPASDEKKVNVTPETLRETEGRLNAHRHAILSALPRADHTVWSWPSALAGEPVAFFRQRLAEDEVLQRLFMKDD